MLDNYLEQKDDEVEGYRQRFAGSQAERADREATAILSAKIQSVAISGKLGTFNFEAFSSYLEWETKMLTCGNCRSEWKKVQQRID